jgi:predicted nuclease with RNAse H fold
MNTMTVPVSNRPHFLSDYVRGLVAARAVAGALGETWPQACAACRAVARQKLGKQRLAPREADEVDALAMAARAHVFERGNPIVRGVTIAPLAGSERVAPTVPDAAVLQTIATTLARVERLLTVLVAVVVRVLPASVRNLFASPEPWRLPAPPASPMESALVLNGADVRRRSFAPITRAPITVRALPARSYEVS